MSVIFYGIVGVLFLAFCVFTYMNTKTWRAMHVIFMFLTFLAACGYLALASMSLKTRATHQSRVVELQSQLEEAQAKGKVLTQGAEDGSTPGAFEAREELGRAILDRGRVWRGVQPMEGQPAGGFIQSVKVSTVSPERLAAGAPPQPHRINAQTILHAFREVPSPQGGEGKVPGVYLGEFAVVDDAPDSTDLTLVPTIPIRVSNAINFNPGDGTTWTLYEQMPVDAHEFFEGLSADEIQALLPNVLPAPQDKWDAVVNEFLRDGKAVDPQAESPINVWAKIKFTQDYTIDVDSEAAQALLESGYFDNTGRAIVDRLRAGAPAVVAEGQELIVDTETAAQLVGDGVAERDAEEPYIYRRPLIDYDFAFHNIYQRSVDLDDSIRIEQRDTATAQDAINKTEGRIAARQAEQTMLQEDNQYLRNEIAELDNLYAAMEQQWADLRTTLSNLYQTNLLMAQEIARIDAETTEAINRRTAEALSGAE